MSANGARRPLDGTQAVPVNPVVTRGTRPGMSTEDMGAYSDDLGRELIPSLRGDEPAQALTVPV